MPPVLCGHSARRSGPERLSGVSLTLTRFVRRTVAVPGVSVPEDRRQHPGAMQRPPTILEGIEESQFPAVLCYHGSIMKKREGVTEKISISLRRSDLASLKKRAKRLYAGNVSAVISELAADAALLEGMHELVSWLGGPSLTDRERKAIDREWSGQRRAPKRARKSKTAA